MRPFMIPWVHRAVRSVLSLLVLTLGVAPGLGAQASGTVETGLLLRQLDGEKRVLMVGAHPDDEDTALLATLARGYGAQTAYLSLSRGEGGQNLIGAEMGEGLGLLRTGELLAARSLDGAHQYFSRAFDFGFSKNADETFRHWPREELVRDVVWVIRAFRPQVVASIFSGTPRDGHGQHQAAGIATRRAFELAGDPSAFPEQLALGVSAWSPQRLYQLDRRGGASSTVRVETGRLDPLLGESYFQLAMDSRSQHRSQDMGAAQTPGIQHSGATLESDGSQVALRGGEPATFFSGIDTTLAGAVRRADSSGEEQLVDLVARYRASVADAVDDLHALEPERSVPHLQEAIQRLQDALAIVRAEGGGDEAEELVAVLEGRERLAAKALLSAAGVTVDVRMDRDRIVPGSRVAAEVTVWNGGSRELTVHGVELALPEGWSVSPDANRFGTLGADSLRTWAFSVDVPSSALPSQPYFLRVEREGDLYEWPADPTVMARPGNPPVATGLAVIALEDGPRIEVRQDASYVGVDKAAGEFRVPVHVVPALSVALEPAVLAWPRDRTQPRDVSVRTRNLSDEEVDAEVTLVAPEGWEASPEVDTVQLSPNGGEASVTFRLRATGDQTTLASVRAVASLDGRTYDEEVELLAYPHVDPVLQLRRAELVLSRFPVEVAPDLTVGYVMGSGDAGPQALADLGVRVESLDPGALPSTNLDRFDAIVLGIRAYETQPELVAANERLLDFARGGGTVVAQYNKYEYPAGDFAPFPVEMSRPHDRVTDPEAEVAFLEPEHPVLSSPNVLGAADFEGWVQERGLYFLNRWDDRYTPLLEMADPGEAPNRGSLVVARVGEGAYVYTGLALFRQIPAGVPGAYRLLANLVSLRGSDL